MNRKEAERLNHQQSTLMSLGFTRDEAESLRRISRTLQRWYELECGDGRQWIERDETTGKPYLYVDGHYLDPKPRRYVTADRETGARKRLEKIIAARNARQTENPPEDWRDCDCCGGQHPADFTGDCRDDSHRWPSEEVTSGLQTYIQTDPRGAALYILRPGDVPEGERADSYYTRGVCVY